MCLPINPRPFIKTGKQNLYHWQDGGILDRLVNKCFSVLSD